VAPFHKVETRPLRSDGAAEIDPGSATAEPLTLEFSGSVRSRAETNETAKSLRTFRQSRQTNNLFRALLALAGIMMILTLAFGSSSTSSPGEGPPPTPAVRDTELPPPRVFVQTD